MSVHIIDNRMKAFEQSVSNAVILGLQGATWETALSKVTEETRALILGSAKSEAIGLRLIQGLEQLLPKPASSVAVSMVHYEETAKDAQKALGGALQGTPKLEEVVRNTNLGFTLSTTALNQTSAAMQSFGQAKAAVPTLDNPFLKRLKKAKDVIIGQTNAIKNHKALEEAIAKVPLEVREALQQTVSSLDEAITQANVIEANLDSPKQEVSLSGLQKTFGDLVEKATSADSVLGDRIKKDLSAMLPAALNLLSIIEKNQLTKTDNFALVSMIGTYVDIYINIMVQYEESLLISFDECKRVNQALYASNVHALAQFFNANFWAHFLENRDEIIELLELAPVENLLKQVTVASEKYKGVMKRIEEKKAQLDPIKV